MKLFIPIYLTIISFIGILIDFFLKNARMLNELQNFIMLVSAMLLLISFSMFMYLFFSRGVENYIDSVYCSWLLRRFLKKPKVRCNLTLQPQIEVDERLYNAALAYTYVDFSRDGMTVYVKIPNNYQAKKVLDGNLANISEQVSTYTNRYICSTPIRQGNYYILKGEPK